MITSDTSPLLAAVPSSFSIISCSDVWKKNVAFYISVVGIIMILYCLVHCDTATDVLTKNNQYINII